MWHGRDIHSSFGVSGFFRGVQLTITRAIVLNAVLLSTYDHFKQLILHHNLLKDGYLTHFMASMGSGLCITIVTSPFDVVKTRIQNQYQVVYKGILDCAYIMIREEGVLAFYKGFTP